MYVHREKLKVAVVLLIHVFKSSAGSINMPKMMKPKASGKNTPKASGKNTKRTDYTQDMDDHMMLLERASYTYERSDEFLLKERWQIILKEFTRKYPDYGKTWKALKTRCTRKAEEEAAGKTVQPYFFPELGEPVIPAPSICPYEAVPPPTATSVSAQVDSDTEYESDGHDDLPDLDALPESLVVFRVSKHMLRASDMGPMDVIHDKEECIEEDEPEDVPRKKRKVHIRLDSPVSPPPEEPMLDCLTF